MESFSFIVLGLASISALLSEKLEVSSPVYLQRACCLQSKLLEEKNDIFQESCFEHPDSG